MDLESTGRLRLRELQMRSCLVWCVLSLTLVGCGGGASVPKGRPKTNPYSGVLTMDGKPVEGASVTFHPKQGGHAATGRTDAEGKFVLQTFVEGDGVVPAEYGISVIKLQNAKSTAVSMDDPKYDPNVKETPPAHLLPVAYSNFTKSGLTETVGAEPVVDKKLEITAGKK